MILQKFLSHFLLKCDSDLNSLTNIFNVYNLKLYVLADLMQMFSFCVPCEILWYSVEFCNMSHTDSHRRTRPQTHMKPISRIIAHSYLSLPLQMCVCVIQSWAPPGGGNLWTASEPLNCATRTASAARVTGSCGSASLVGTRSAAPCWPPRSARGRWRCCRTRRCTTAAARGA